MENLIYGEFRQRIKRLEGFRALAYWDSKKNLTGGWGHNFSSKWMPQEYIDRYGVRSIVHPITKVQAEMLLTNDLQDAIKDIARFFGFNTMSNWPAGVQYCLVDMMFNMGYSSFRSFKKMIEAVRQKDYKNIVKEIINSKYYLRCTEKQEELKAKGIKRTFHRAQLNVEEVLKNTFF